MDYTCQEEKSKECYTFWALCDADGKEVPYHPLVSDEGCQCLGGSYWQSRADFVNIGHPDVIHIRKGTGKEGSVITLKKKK